MQQSNVPSKSPIVFGASATGTYIRTVPQTTADPAAASFTLGFPPQTFTDEGAGGTPPDGRDFNGILNHLSAWTRWFMAGGPITYDSAFQSAVGGYPAGAIVGSATTPGKQYRSTVDNNTTNPDTGGAGWATVTPQSGSNANGYWNIGPDGLIRQWGTRSVIQGEGPIAQTFPIAFTSLASISPSATIISDGTDANDMWTQIDPGWSTSGMTVRYQSQTSGNTGRGFCWQAIGY